MSNITTPALRYHGAKFRLAPWIISHMPNHLVYAEPFGGAAGVLLQKPRSYSEVYNDLDGDIVNFFKVLRDPNSSQKLRSLISRTPYAREEFELAFTDSDDPIERARRTAIRAQMGFGSGGSTKNSTGFRNDSKRKYGTAAHNWVSYSMGLDKIADRLKGVIIENTTALKIIEQHDSPETLFFVDPPYVMSTREGRKVYRHEMCDREHEELLQALIAAKGMVLLSGYECELYVDALESWQLKKTESRISAGRGTAVKTECLWINPRCAESLNSDLFGITEAV